MDNLMLFYPLIVLLFFIFFDVRNRKKRPAPPPQQPADWQTQLPEERQGRGKSSLRRKIPVRNLHRQQNLLFRNPCINVLSRRSPSLPLKAFAAAGQ